jgi:hypothetical protein
MERHPDHERFWGVADEFIATGRVEEGTMMGHPCLRATAGGGFVATVERSSGNLVVKLPKDRVADLIGSGEGLAFAPAGKAFKEWVAIPAYDADRWSELIDESIAFVGRDS